MLWSEVCPIKLITSYKKPSYANFKLKVVPVKEIYLGKLQKYDKMTVFLNINR